MFCPLGVISLGGKYKIFDAGLCRFYDGVKGSEDEVSSKACTSFRDVCGCLGTPFRFSIREQYTQQNKLSSPSQWPW
jgi:hypothetical protein